MSPRTPLLVGLVLIVSLTGLTYFVLTTTKDKFAEDATYPVYADFVDASGIRWKTRVQVNGIDVGSIDSIEHVRGEEGRLTARVKLRVLKEYTLYEDASLRKAAESLLGDFRLDLDPGTPDRPPLPPGGVIKQVQSLSDLDEIQSELKQVVRNVSAISESFSSVLSGPRGQGSLQEILTAVEHSMKAIEETTEVLSQVMAQNDQHIARILANLGEVSTTLAEATRPGGNIARTTESLAQLSSRLDRVANSISGMVEGEPNEPERGTLRDTVDGLHESVSRLNNVARKIDQGQGTVGRLINDPALAEKVEETVDSANDIFGNISRIETQIELRSEVHVPWGSNNELVQTALKNSLALKIRPRPDKYYLLEAIADPRGVQTRDVIATTENGSTTTVEQVSTSFNTLKFSAQFAKRYYFATLRFGIIENTGGLGINLHALEDDLELRLDVYDFDRRDPEGNRSINPRLRGALFYEFVNHLSLQVGLDDPFNARLRTYFLGGSLRFTDEDLKTLLTVAPTP